MSRRIYGVWTVLVVSFIGLGLIVWKTSPENVLTTLKTLFFSAFLMAIWSSATLIIFAIKSRFARSRLFDEAAYEPVFYDSLLRGLLVTGIIMAAILVRKLL